MAESGKVKWGVRAVVGLCLLLGSGGLMFATHVQAVIAMGAIIAGAIATSAVVGALCGWATILSILTPNWRQRLLVVSGIGFLVGAFAAMAASALLPPSAQDMVGAVALVIIGVGGLLFIGIAMAYVAEFAWDTAREARTTMGLWLHLVFRNELPPHVASAARDHQRAMAQLHRMSPRWAETVEGATHPAEAPRPIQPAQSPAGPWGRRALAIMRKGYITAVCTLLVMRLGGLLLSGPAWLGQLLGGLIGVAPLIGAILLLPLAITLFITLAAPVVLMTPDWRPESPLRHWWARCVVTGSYSLGLGLMVGGVAPIFFDAAFGVGALLVFGAIGVLLVVVGLLGGLVSAIARRRSRVPANIAR